MERRHDSPGTEEETVRVVGVPVGGLKTVGHTGTQGGFYCDYVTIPEKKIFYVMLANFPIDRDLLNHEVIRMVREL